MSTILRQDAIVVVSDDSDLAAEFDAEWVDQPALTVGERLRLMDDLAVEVLRRHGYEVGRL